MKIDMGLGNIGWQSATCAGCGWIYLWRGIDRLPKNVRDTLDTSKHFLSDKYLCRRGQPWQEMRPDTPACPAYIEREGVESDDP